MHLLVSIIIKAMENSVMTRTFNVQKIPVVIEETKTRYYIHIIGTFVPVGMRVQVVYFQQRAV